jgi:hypothetical protein
MLPASAAISAVARARTSTGCRRSSASRTSVMSRTTTVTRVGAKRLRGNATSTPAPPDRYVRRRAAPRPRRAPDRPVREVARVRHAALEHGRLEQATEVAPHHLRRGHRREISRPLRIPASAKRLAEAEQHQHPGNKCGQHTEHQQHRPATLVGRRTRSRDGPRRSAGGHRPRRSRAPPDRTRRERHKFVTPPHRPSAPSLSTVAARRRRASETSIQQLEWRDAPCSHVFCCVRAAARPGAREINPSQRPHAVVLRGRAAPPCATARKPSPVPRPGFSAPSASSIAHAPRPTRCVVYSFRPAECPTTWSCSTGPVTIAGRANATSYRWLGPVQVTGRVDGDLIAMSDRTFLGPTARVGGDLRYGDEPPRAFRCSSVARACKEPPGTSASVRQRERCPV